MTANHPAMARSDPASRRSRRTTRRLCAVVTLNSADGVDYALDVVISHSCGQWKRNRALADELCVRESACLESESATVVVVQMHGPKVYAGADVFGFERADKVVAPDL